MVQDKQKIKPETMIAEALKLNPAAGGILMEHGMHCLGCVIAQGETIEQAAEVHGIPLEELLEELNKE